MTKKQIEKKAKELCREDVYGCNECCDECVQEIEKQKMIDLANWVLSHQWVSVEDELPSKKDGDNESEYVFARLTCGKLPWTACYSYEHQCWMDVNHQAIHSVTHWMSIPPMAEGGGEK